MNDYQIPADDPRSARRRLLKGSFAMPAVLTVASGGASARTSSGCIAREANAGQTADFDAANATWVRVLAYTYLKNSGSTRSYWVRYDELNALALLAGVSIKNNWIVSGQALCVQGGDEPTGNGLYVSGTIYPTPGVLVSSASPTQPTGTVRYYAVAFDSQGNIIGISTKFTASGQTGGAVHQSCWNSFQVP